MTALMPEEQKQLAKPKQLQEEEARLRHNLRNRVFLAMGVVVIMWLLGSLLFHNIEDWSFTDSMYFSASTLTTVGYGDLVPRTQLGKLVSIPFMFFGVGVILYSISIVGAYYAERQFEALTSYGFHRLRRLPKFARRKRE
ncbi:MAG: potassium channel family protein [Candidatus Micrarchaeota archaeon]